ncbi:K02A2.6-like, partial [Cordylochernes scorpioides]
MRTRSGLFYEMANADQKPLEAPTVEAGVTTGGDAGFDPIPFNPSLNNRKYAGDEDPRQWITSLEEVGFLYRWADYIINRYAAMNLVGPAKTWYEFHKVNLATWEIFKTRLIQDFASLENKDEMMLKLNRMQGWNELAMRFAEDILLQCSKVQPNMEEMEKIQFVIGGLKKEYALALYLNPLKTIDELLEACKRIDGFEKEYLERKEKNKILMNRISQKETNHAGWNRQPREFQSYKTEDYSRPMMGAPRQNQTYFPPQETHGKRLNILGSISMDIKIDEKSLNHRFVVLESNMRSLIIGRDLLRRLNAKINCKRDILEYDIVTECQDSNEAPKKIINQQDEVVPQLCVKLVRVTVKANDGEYVVEPNEKLTLTNGLRISRCLITVRNKLADLWITNPYPRTLKIMKNQTLGYASPPTMVNYIEDDEEDKVTEIQINEDLTLSQKNELRQVLSKYSDLFSSKLGKTNLAKHRIDTENAKPIKHKPYRVSPKERDIIKEQIQDMLQEGVIRASSSPWAFPVILVRKRDGNWRFCVDYRKLNSITVKDVYPIPRIDDVMDTLQGSRYFTAIDLRSGYWQVEIEEQDKKKTAFTTSHGLYEFNVMPFGLCNAPATFERIMDNVLKNIKWKFCLCYLDDVLIYSPDFTTHLGRIEAVLKCFRESNLRLNGKKKFIKNFSRIADPLFKLTRKDSPFNWSESQEEAFITLKSLLTNPPILSHFDPEAPTQIHTDASNIGLGATLVQTINGQEKVISYISRSLSKPERNYSTMEKECLALVWSMSKLRPYLYGRRFKVMTDHHALCWLRNLRDPTGRLARWALKIQEYDFEIIYKSGKKHLDADGLSRGPLPETDFDDNYDSLFFNPVIEDSDEYTEGKRSIVENFKEENGCLYKRNPRPEGRAWLLVVPRGRKKDILKEHHNHMICGHLGVTRTMHRLKDKYFWSSMLKDVVEYVRTCHLCQSRIGSNQLPAGLLHPIPAANYPFERVGIDFLGPLPSTKNRKKWMIVLTDYYTKYAETKAVIDATAREVAKYLTENVILKHGAPRYLISDRGSQFTSNLVKEITKICQIQHCLTTSYHPQTNGLTERLNRTLINMKSMYVNVDQRNWEEILPFITHAYNTTIQETTKYSPFFLLYGREPVSILDDTNIFIEPGSEDYDEYVSKLMEKIVRTRDIVKVNTERSQEKMINYYNQKHRQTGYEPGDLVALWTPIRKPGKCEKLLRRYFGPYIVLKKISGVNYSIVPEDNPGNRTQPTTVHISRIKPYFARMEDGHEDATISEEGEVSHSAKTFWQGKADLWIANGTSKLLIIPSRMVLGTMSDVDFGSICYLKCDELIQEEEIWTTKLDQKIEAMIDLNLTEDHQNKMMNVLENFSDVFDFCGKSQPARSKIKHKIDTGDHAPTKQRPYRVSRMERKIIQQKVDRMMDQDIIQFSESPWSSPVVLVKKKVGSWRFCVDYRRLNKITKKDVYPLPRVDDALDNLSGARYCSSMDLRTDYWQIEVDEHDSETTAFITPDGLYEFRVMPFGLCNTLATFERMMDTVLKGLKWNICLCYLDDIVVYGPSFEEPLKRSEVLECLQQSGLNVNHEKCLFGSRQFKILGHIVNENRIHSDTEKVEAILKFPPLKSIPDIRRFLGLCSYYRRFVENLSHKAKHLNHLLKNDVKFCWNKEKENAIEILKEALTSEPVLGHFNEDAETHIHTVASGYGIGAVLIQIQGDIPTEVDPGTRPLLTINTHKGLFRFKRMPFGLANAPSYFQSVMDRVLSGIGGVICYIDDVLIATASIEEHLALLKTIFARLAKYNIKLKKEKCLFLQKEIEYLGHLVTEEGIRPLDHKVQAIQKAKTPTNISELRSFLGLVNFYGKFIPNLPELLKPLHELLHKKRPWVWTKECGEAIDKCKNSITSERVLVPYDATLPLCLATDASQIGVGAVLSHIIEGQERPIMFASRTLSEAEQNYSQIEKEALAIIYGVTKFHQFIYGRKFILITDHKPLVTILGSRSGIPTLSTSRLQRWALILSAYTYDIKFRRTQDHGNADLLSRFPVGCEEIPRLNNVYALSYVEELPITAEEIAMETEKDEVLSLAKFYTQQGWPEKVADHLRPYFQRKLELTVDGECLVWGMRVVIPPSLRIKMLNCLHETHSGMNKMKAVARSHFWWPNLDTQIEFLVNKCRSCQQSQDGPNKGKWQPWKWSTRPWQRIHIDFANKENINLLIVVDSHSKWIEAIPMRETTTRKTIEQLRRLFSSYGLPEELVSDNGPQFTGSEMKGFLEGNGIKQTLIPAYHPQSNGLAERAVRTIKTALDKNKRKIGDTIQDTLSKVLLAYRSTPHVTTGKTPSELFIGRALRTRVSLIHPSLASRVRDQQARQMKYDRRTHLEEFQIDDLVWCKNFRGGDKWIPGKIVGKKGTRVYTILIHGQVKAYHRDQIRKRWRNGEEDESGDGERQPEHSRGAGPSAIISEVVRDRGYMESLSPGLTSQRSDQDSEVQSDTDDGKSLEPLRSLDPEALKEEGPVLRRNPPRARRPP